MNSESTSAPILMPTTASTANLALRQQLESEWQNTQFVRRARRLAKAMLPHLTIVSEGKELLIWINGPEVHDNLSALQCWVAEQLADPSFDLACGAGSERTELLIRLERHCLWQDAANDDQWD